jgi:dihydroorotate dehydrogenase
MTQGVRERSPFRYGERTAGTSPIRPLEQRGVTALGLAFPNPLGLAAGFDRTGELISSLRPHGFGHVEIGTITPATGFSGALKRTSSLMRVGVNIGSARPGLDDRVIEDYVAMLKQVSRFSDYVVANLTAPTLRRDGNTAGVDKLVKRLSIARDVLSAVEGHLVPLLLKIEAGVRDTRFPAAVMAARVGGIDGVVLVSDCVERIGAISSYLDGISVISVGGVRTTEDVVARLAAGASLVQVHGAFVNSGAARVRRILKELRAHG